MINTKQAKWSEAINTLRSMIAGQEDTVKLKDFFVTHQMYTTLAIENQLNLNTDLQKVLNMFNENQVYIAVPHVDYGYSHVTHFIENAPERVAGEVNTMLLKAADIPNFEQELIKVGLVPQGTDYLAMPQRLPGTITIGIETKGIVPGIYPNKEVSYDNDNSKAIIGLTVGDVKGLISKQASLYTLIKDLTRSTNHNTRNTYISQGDSITRVMADLGNYVDDATVSSVSAMSGVIKAHMATEYLYNQSIIKNLHRVANSVGEFMEAINNVGELDLPVTPAE